MSSDREARAADLLPADHPFNRSCRAVHILARQAAACAALLAGIMAGSAPRPDRAGWPAACAALVDAVLAGLLLGAMAERRRRARDVIIERGRADLAELRSERLRLLAPAHRRALARHLGDALDAAGDWEARPPASRPPASVRNLLASAPVARAVTAALEMEDASLRGVALVDRLLDGSYGSPLYRDDPVRLGAELARAAFELAATCDHEPPETHRPGSAVPTVTGTTPSRDTRVGDGRSPAARQVHRHSDIRRGGRPHG